MSYDDGSEHDRRLIKLFNRYGIRGSFHLNSGRLGSECQVRPDEVSTLYEGHEVACHTVSHPDLTQLSSDEIRHEILEDKKVLEALTGTPVRGLAYPFGNYDTRVTSLLPLLGIEYARTVTTIEGFKIPENWLTWETTCHHNLAMELGKLFLKSPAWEMKLMYVWGHSYELDGFMSGDSSKNWQYMESFCQLMYDHEQVFYATTIEIVDYLKALEKVIFCVKDSTIDNPSDEEVWINWRGATIAIGPGTTCLLNESKGQNP